MALKDLMNRVERAAFEPERSESGAGARAPAATAPAYRSAASSTAIDAGMQLVGTLAGNEDMRIDGQVEGEIRCEKTIYVGQRAHIKAAIYADAVVIAGEVKGDIEARRKVTLESSARVTGDLATPGIVIEEGAKLEGRIVISGNGPAQATPEAQARPSAPARENAPAAAGATPPRTPPGASTGT
jgi:cytoskeletal protein CcmA (bactofilin family)